MYQSHGHAFLLAVGLQHQPETIPILLAPGPQEPCQLLGKTSSSGASPQHETSVPNTFQPTSGAS
jgi:hypothetical protein